MRMIEKIKGSPYFYAVFYALFLSVFVLMAYTPSLSFEFVWDDHPLILKNPLWFDKAGVFKMFFSNFWAVSERLDSFRHFYRPLVTFSYWLNYQLAGFDAGWFHAFNVAIHIINTVFAFLLARIFTGSSGAALIAAVVFGLHPTHVENVAWISGRTDLLAAFFVLPALYFWILAAENKNKYLEVAAYFCFYLALLCKEVAIVTPLAAVIFWRQLGLNNTPILKRAVFISAILITIYFIQRKLVLGVVASNMTFPGLETYLPALGLVLMAYVRLSLIFFLLDPHYSDLQFHLIKGWQVVGGLLVLGLFVLLSIYLWKKNNAWGRAYWLWLLFLAPVFSLGSFGDVLYADRFLYLPSLGLGLLAALLFNKWQQLKPPINLSRETVAILSAGGLALVYLVFTVQSSLVWRNNIVLFERASRSSPDSVLIWNNLGLAYTYQHEWTKARLAFEKALEIKSDYGFARHNLAVVLRQQGQFPEAVSEFSRAIAKEPLDSLYTYNLAETYAAWDKKDQAEWWYKKTLLLKPDNYQARHNLGYLRLEKGEFIKAREDFKKVINAHRHPVKSLNALGILNAKQQEFEQARIYFKKALALEPDYKPALENLIRLEQAK
jgi:protein O-mannosyl-transferase